MRYLILMTMVACGAEHGDPEARALQLHDDVIAQDYPGFARAPGWTEAHRAGTSSHHGKFLDIYINSTLVDALASGPPWPIGSIIVKDGRRDAAATDRASTSILEKTGDAEWFGAEYNASGTVREAGWNYRECDSCHASAADYVLAF